VYNIRCNVHLAHIAVSSIEIAAHLTLDAEIERRTLTRSRSQILSKGVEISTGENLGEIGYGILLDRSKALRR
jgi:hypothetical protein